MSHVEMTNALTDADRTAIEDSLFEMTDDGLKNIAEENAQTILKYRTENPSVKPENLPIEFGRAAFESAQANELLLARRKERIGYNQDPDIDSQAATLEAAM